MINAYQQARREKKQGTEVRHKALATPYQPKSSVFIASSAAMENVVHAMKQVAATDANILSWREWHGKEVVAGAFITNPQSG
jgi:transcriptional regulator with GAF, ATPase, and Fis domain